MCILLFSSREFGEFNHSGLDFLADECPAGPIAAARRVFEFLHPGGQALKITKKCWKLSILNRESVVVVAAFNMRSSQEKIVNQVTETWQTE